MRTLRQLMRCLPVDGKARDAIRKFNLAPNIDGKARSVKDLAIQLGFDVERRALPRGMAGRLVQDAFAENGYRIEVNEKLGVEAQRWSVLHEIGHFFRHIDRDDPLCDPMHLDRSAQAFYVNENEEREANEFAEVVLFGDGAIRAAASLYNNDVKRLARHFGVSEKVIEIALERF